MSSEFLVWLSSGSGRSFLDALLACELDIRLRDDYFNAYEAQSSVVKVSWRPKQNRPRIELAAAHVAGTPFAKRRAEGYVSILATDEALQNFQRALPGICRRVRDKYTSIEGRWEADVVRTNQASAPFFVLDRQIQYAGQRRRLDLLAVSRDSREPYLIAVDLKRDLDHRAQLVPRLLESYLEQLDPGGKGLRPEIADAYANICEQLAALGLPAPAPTLIRKKMRVEALVAVARYKHASPQLGRARTIAAGMKRAIWFCTIEDANPRIPERAAWFR